MRHLQKAYLIALLLSAAFVTKAEPPATAEELGLMSGSPPGDDQLVTVENAFLPPYNRWSFLHMRELFPTRGIEPPAIASDLAQEPIAIRSIQVSLADDQQITAGEWLDNAYTDGFIVLHDGKVAYEQYLNGQNPHSPHIMFSVTKSFTSALILTLAEEGLIDLSETVSRYIPVLAETAYGDASVQHVMDMTNSIQYDETYDDPESDIGRYFAALAPGGRGLYHHLTTLDKQLPGYAHGEAFQYVTPDTEVLGWIVRSVTGLSLAENLESRIWKPMGAEYPAHYMLDPVGIELAGAGLSISLRDAARFGQMVLNDGRYNGQQVLSASVAARIKHRRNTEAFTRYYDDPWYHVIAEDYHDQWWSYRGVNAVVALGIHGQFIYVNSDHNVVIVKQTSDPYAEGTRVDNETPLVMHAIAAHLGSRSGMTD